MKEPKLYIIVRPLIRIFTNFCFRPKYIGIENIPKEGNYILAGNHTNNLDCLLLISSTKRVVHFLAKDSLVRGLKKVIFKNMGIIPVNRKIHDSNALNMGKKCLNNGGVIGIFPEGTINRTSDIVMPFKYGAVKMASSTNSHVVPFVIKNKYKFFKKSVQIEFLKPYKVSNDLDFENNKLMKLISDKLTLGG